MKKFIIAIEETVSQTFDVLAENVDEALMIAQSKYRKCEFVLEPGELICKQIASVGDNPTEWTEF